MFFTFIECESGFAGELLYIQDESSLMYYPWNTNANVSIMCGAYTGLDTICETGLIVQLSGLSPKSVWLPMKLKMPQAIKGNLTVHFDSPPMKGTAVDYDRNWKTYYNKNESCICVGECHILDSDICIEFTSNVVAVLRNSQLVAIWGRIREVHTVTSLPG